jgi:hypothetical protein
MVVVVKKQVHAVVGQQETWQLQSLPNVDYPGCEIDLSATRDAISSGSKSKTLRMYRKMKEKQRVYDYYLNVNESNDPESNGSEQREIEQWNDENPSSNKSSEDIFRGNKLEDLQSWKEDDVFEGDRSHSNIVALKKLALTYPGWEEDVKEALDDSHQSYQPHTLFQDKFRSLKVKQDLHDGYRSHWRLLKLDDLNLTYPGYKTDIKQVEDWHIANADNRKNNVIFHEVIEVMLDQQQLYLGWDHEQILNPFPDVDKIDAQINHYRHSRVVTKEEVDDYNEMKYSDNFKNETLDKLIDQKKKVLEKRSLLKSTRSSKSTFNKERRELETENHRYRSSSFSSLSSSSSSSLPRQMASNNAYHLRPTTSKTPAGSKLGNCQVCSTRTKTHVCVPCGHLACAACSYHSLRTTTRCSICNEHADKVVRVEL